MVRKTSSLMQESIWTKSFILIALINITTFIGFNMTTAAMAATTAVYAVPSERRGVSTSTFLFGSDAGMAVELLFQVQVKAQSDIVMCM